MSEPKTYGDYPSSQLLILPTNEIDLDIFMNAVISAYFLPDTEDTRDMIATMILHMPQSKVWATMQYFGEAVLKGMANQAAFSKLATYKANREKIQADKALKETEKTNAESPSDETI